MTRFIHLDMLRGVASLAVVVGHMRGFLLVDYGDLSRPGLAEKATYFVTGLGHEAVIAFFALSGYVVGGKAVLDMVSGRWSWGPYLVARLTRLWTVALPALLLTSLFDAAGKALTGGAGYDGSFYGLLSSGPTINGRTDDSVLTLLANIAFLQTIVAPTFGTNGPLWSLANEFWYYILFPLAASAILLREATTRKRAAAFAAGALALALPGPMVALGAIWVAGACARYLADRPGGTRLFDHRLYLVGACIAVAANLLHRTASDGITIDILHGGAWAAFLPVLAAQPPFGKTYERLAEALSTISYTLYATHFPFLAFVWFTALAPTQSAPGMHVLALAITLLGATLLYAYVVWWCFERNTGRIRSAVMTRVGMTNRSDRVHAA